MSLSSFFAPGGISAFLQTRSGVRSTQAAWCFISSPGDNYYQLGLSASLVLVLGRAECFGISPYFMLSTSSLQARCTWTIDRVILKVSQWILHLTYINYEIQMVFPSSIGFPNFPFPRLIPKSYAMDVSVALSILSVACPYASQRSRWKIMVMGRSSINARSWSSKRRSINNI